MRGCGRPKEMTGSDTKVGLWCKKVLFSLLFAIQKVFLSIKAYIFAASIDLNNQFHLSKA